MELTEPQAVALDWARGLSAQVVLFGHAIGLSLAGRKVLVQDLGVDVFFLISGFLITASILRKPTTYGFGDFVADRGARIFVPYVPAVALIVLVGLCFNLSGPYDLTTIGGILTLQDFPLHRFLSSFPEIDRVGTGRPLWSVAMEWWFYMAAAGVYFFGRPIPVRGYTLIVVGALVAAFNLTVGFYAYTWAFGAIAAVVFNTLPRAPWSIIAVTFALLAAYRYTISGAQFVDLSFTVMLATCIFQRSKGR